MTEFIARAKRTDNNTWVVGSVFNGQLTAEVNVTPEFGAFFLTDKPRTLIEHDHVAFEVNKKTVCYQCPDTPYFEHDVLKVIVDNDEEVIDEVFFAQGAFIFAIQEDEWVTLPILMEMGYTITHLGNSIDNPDLIQ